MKAGITGMAALLLFVLVCAAIYTVDGRSAREKELSDTVSSAVEESMERVCLSWKQAESMQEKKEVMADFTAGLLVRFGSKSKISLRVLYLDAEEGMLDVEIRQEFTHFSGEKGSIRIRRSILMEEEEKERTVRDKRAGRNVIINKGLHKTKREEAA